MQKSSYTLRGSGLSFWMQESVINEVYMGQSSTHISVSLDLLVPTMQLQVMKVPYSLQIIIYMGIKVYRQWS